MWGHVGSEGGSDAHAALSVRGWAAGAGRWLTSRGKKRAGPQGGALGSGACVWDRAGRSCWDAGVRTGRGGKCVLFVLEEEVGQDGLVSGFWGLGLLLFLFQTKLTLFEFKFQFEFEPHSIK